MIMILLRPCPLAFTPAPEKQKRVGSGQLQYSLKSHGHFPLCQNLYCLSTAFLRLIDYLSVLRPPLLASKAISVLTIPLLQCDARPRSFHHQRLGCREVYLFTGIVATITCLYCFSRYKKV